MGSFLMAYSTALSRNATAAFWNLCTCCGVMAPASRSLLSVTRVVKPITNFSPTRDTNQQLQRSLTMLYAVTCQYETGTRLCWVTLVTIKNHNSQLESTPLSIFIISVIVTRWLQPSNEKCVEWDQWVDSACVKPGQLLITWQLVGWLLKAYFMQFPVLQCCGLQKLWEQLADKTPHLKMSEKIYKFTFISC